MVNPADNSVLINFNSTENGFQETPTLKFDGDLNYSTAGINSVGDGGEGDLELALLTNGTYVVAYQSCTEISFRQVR